MRWWLSRIWYGGGGKTAEQRRRRQRAQFIEEHPRGTLIAVGLVVLAVIIGSITGALDGGPSQAEYRQVQQQQQEKAQETRANRALQEEEAQNLIHQSETEIAKEHGQ